MKHHEIWEVIAIGIATAQQTFLRLKPFVYGNSRVFPKTFLASTSALFFPLSEYGGGFGYSSLKK